MRSADLDCVTLDAYGTLVALEDPVGELEQRLRARSVVRGPGEIDGAFAQEAAYYRRHTLDGHDPESLEKLRLRCCRVFAEALGADLDPADFLPDFLASLSFRAEPGAADALRELRGRGLKLAVVSNWDYTLPERLKETGLLELVDEVISSASCGAEKPDPRIFHCALERLSVEPERALHIGDGEVDRAGALAAGMSFAAAPLAKALEGWE